MKATCELVRRVYNRDTRRYVVGADIVIAQGSHRAMSVLKHGYDMVRDEIDNHLMPVEVAEYEVREL